jgi:LPS-assembly protein
LTPRRTRTLTIALLCALFTELAGAQDTEGLRLRVERQLRMAPTRPERDSAKFLEADRIVGESDKTVVATGNVTLRQRGATIRADRVDYHADEQVAIATGRVQLERDGDTATGPRLNYHLDNDTGEMELPVFNFPKRDDRRVASRGQAERALLEENRASRLFRAEYTSCPAPRDDWFIRVRELELDGTRNIGTAYNTTVYFLGVPILYSPWLSFPLDNARKSGFLAPTFGSSGQSGFEAALPYYWNIAPNMDATLTPKLFTKRGVQLGGEFRYLMPKYTGQLDMEYLPNDRVANRDRDFIAWRHSQQLWKGWSFGVNAQRVSDDNYFRDLSTQVAATSQTNLPRDAALAYGDDTWAFSARALSYQTLQDPLGPPVPIPYRILPQLLVAGARQNVYGFDWGLSGELSNFRHPTFVNGQRFIAYPSIALPLRSNYGYVMPKIGYHFTRYNVDRNAEGIEDASRGVAIASVDSGLFFDRSIRFGQRDFQQTLEPRLFYLNVPYRDQSRMPNFTTVESDFNFAQIFTENRFVGGDRIGDANQLTLGLTSRLIESATGLERFTASLGQVYYFRPPRVTLGTQPAADAKSSDILFAASSQMSPSVTLEGGFQYTPNLSRSQKLTLAAHYMPVPGRIINAAYRYARGSSDPSADPSAIAGIEQVDLSAQWPITGNLSAVARWNWSIQDRKLLEGVVGFEYNVGCWQVRAVAHRLITATQTYSTSFQIQLELSGLSRIGINPLETLRQNIPGYRRADEIAPDEIAP